MPKVNWKRLLLGGLVATLICFVTDVLMHNFIVNQDWVALARRGNQGARHQGHGTAIVSFSTSSSAAASESSSST